MYRKVELLNKETHKNIAIKEIANLSFAKELMSAPLTAGEFFEACKDYPIVFVKDEKGNWSASAVFGYKEKENLFIGADNKWESGRYIPGFIRRYPFLFVKQGEQIVFAFDATQASEDEADQARRFFTPEGESTKMLDDALKFLNQYTSDERATAEFIKQLDSWGLLEEKTASFVNKKGEQHNLSGLYVVSEEKLKHLGKKKQDAICHKQATPLITAHLISLSNVQRLGLKT